MQGSPDASPKHSRAEFGEPGARSRRAAMLVRTAWSEVQAGGRRSTIAQSHSMGGGQKAAAERWCSSTRRIKSTMNQAPRTVGARRRQRVQRQGGQGRRGDQVRGRHGGGRPPTWQRERLRQLARTAAAALIGPRSWAHLADGQRWRHDAPPDSGDDDVPFVTSSVVSRDANKARLR